MDLRKLAFLAAQANGNAAPATSSIQLYIVVTTAPAQYGRVHSSIHTVQCAANRPSPTEVVEKVSARLEEVQHAIQFGGKLHLDLE